MKRLRLIAFLLLLIPLRVYGDNKVVMLWCPEKITSGAVMSCAIYVPENVRSFSAELYLSDNMKLVNSTANKNYNNSSNGINLYFSLKADGLTTTGIGYISVEGPKVNVDTAVSLKLKSIKIDGKYVENSNTSRVNVIAKTTTKKKITTTTTTPTTTTIKDNTSSTTVKKNAPFMVRLNSNGGNLSEQSLECVPSSGQCTVDLTLVSSPTKEGYTFTGWGNTKDCVNGNTSSYIAKENVLLYACYTKSEDQIIIDNNLYLQSLVVDNYDINFSKETNIYNLTVLNEVEKINVIAVADDSSAMVSVEGNDYLQVGNNVIKIVLNKNDLSSTYTINVKRLAPGETISDDTAGKLSKISFGKYKVKIEPEVYEYTLVVGYKTKSLKVDAIPVNNDATISVMGNDNILDGSIITVDITETDGFVGEYSFKIKEESFLDTYKKYLIIGGIVLLLIIIYTSVAISKKKDDSKNNNKKKTEKKTDKEKIEVLKL